MNTDNPWLFDLARFDEDPQPSADDPGNQDPEPEPNPEPAEIEEPDGSAELGDKGKRALDAMKAEKLAAKREAVAAKKRADDLAAKVAEFEDRDKSETEKLTQRAEQAEARAKVATERAVKAEVRALASDTFIDPTDAVQLGDLAKYVGADGEVDADAIQLDLDALLDRKPHLRKPDPTPESEPPKRAKPAPKPDPGQGPRKEPEPVDFRTADKATVDAELARLGVRNRS